jgi:hypothetical protein
MKTKFLVLIGLSTLLFQCSTEEDVSKKSPLWGVEFSEESTATFVQGALEQQNAGPNVTYIANAGALRQTEVEGVYTISFAFEGGESLEVAITKKTTDYNYHFPGSEAENQLLYAKFNGNSLDLKESAIAIQPHKEENKLHVITNMHTVNAGDFNGTLTRIPLLKEM